MTSSSPDGRMDGGRFSPSDRGDRSDDFEVSTHLNIIHIITFFSQQMFVSFGDRFVGEIQKGFECLILKRKKCV